MTTILLIYSKNIWKVIQWWPQDLKRKSRKQFVELVNDHFLPESPTCLVGLTGGPVLLFSSTIDWRSSSKFFIGGDHLLSGWVCLLQPGLFSFLADQGFGLGKWICWTMLIGKFQNTGFLMGKHNNWKVQAFGNSSNGYFPFWGGGDVCVWSKALTDGLVLVYKDYISLKVYGALRNMTSNWQLWLGALCFW